MGEFEIKFSIKIENTIISGKIYYYSKDFDIFGCRILERRFIKKISPTRDVDIYQHKFFQNIGKEF